MSEQRITSAEQVAEATGQDVEKIKEAWQRIEEDQQKIVNQNTKDGS